MKEETTPLKRLLKYMKARRGTVWLATIYSILNKIFDIAPPLLIGMTVDVVVKKEDSFVAGFGFHTMMEQIYAIAGLTIVVWVLESFFEYLLKVKWRGLAQNVQNDLRLDTYNHVQKLELSYFENKSTGNLISIMNDDVNQLERFLDDGANSLIQVATTVISIGIIFFYFSPLIAALSFLPVPMVLFGSYFFQKRIEKRYRSVRDNAGLLNSILNNNLAGIATIKSYCAEVFEAKRIKEQSTSYAMANFSAIKLSSLFSPLIRMVILCGFLMTMIVGANKVQSGALEIGSYSVLIFLTQRLLWPLTSLGQTYDLFQRAMASANRIFDLMETPLGIKDGDAISDEEVESIHFNNISFAYEEGFNVLNGIDIKVDSGKTIAIVGSTGSGKSTLVKLLLRFYDCTKGAIELGSHRLTEISQQDLRKKISYVGQDNYLFHGTVEENIAYGIENANREEIIKAAKTAEAHEFIMSLPNGYQTLVGERGQKLSGGQRQRISIARAVMKNSPIFIFDEATSAVDNETEAAIQRSLNKITNEKTTIMIAHRLSTIRHAHQIYVLEKGVVTENGTHEELLAKGGMYKSLWSVQTGE
ncbi:ABC transporter ATP-binding protein [Halobacteriovorax marinus SJ]|uniref:ABC transporter ATP-binding protein n=1 Tax=Halobacteriovorax marinus (strain ATCC BAA-682 / DSM 15412 / SJ) TaxID=862908 RepID=E1X633_HALMS|nr:ABC transporter ATP-binding protein [Halobacteriovorax marinus]CBW27377.1 ABC transporter ATP-binding protein [Halobacteriovorax marinus SJ]